MYKLRVACALVACLCSGTLSAEDVISFSRQIQPILSENCYSCHGFDASAREANLRLDIPNEDESDSGEPAIVPGQPDESELVRRIFLADDEQMPPADSGKSLTEEQRQLVRLWIEQGANYESHWAFLPPQKPDVPVVEGVSHPIDRFIQSRLEKEGVQPSPLAEPHQILRRLHLDLTGLPPLPEEIENFRARWQASPEQAIRQTTKRLLASPHYGERWGRWWLDQARYADSNGYSIDAPRQIWKFRDWVVQALNDDMPFDQFTVEQLAGDLLPEATQSQRVATGFHRNTQINQEGGIDKEQFRIDSVFDRVATTGTVWMGLTIGCAQCHDHKFDPITQREYYQLFSFFNNQDEPSIKVYDDAQAAPGLAKELRQVEKQMADLIESRREDFQSWEDALTEAEKKKLSSGARKAIAVAKEKRSAAQKRLLFAIEVGKTDKDYQALEERRAELDRQVNGVATTLVLKERTEPRDTFVLIKGDFTRPSEQVYPGTPAILPPLEAGEKPNRLDLARWIVDPKNPLTARVIVNRVWQVYFGRGLVETENDFGALGANPSNPELLDWLAVQFRESGWSMKRLHELIVTSHTYLQSSNARDDLADKDPNNYWLARQERLRLEAELVRDVCLQASGRLSSKLGGPPVYPPIPDGVMGQGQVKRAWRVSTGEDRFRRGLYTFIYRGTPPPSLNVFDAPEGFSTCTRRTRSNTPLQALTLMNDAAFFELAEGLVTIIKEQGLADAFVRCTSREPSAEEMAVLEPLDPLTAARVLLNLDETVTRE